MSEPRPATKCRRCRHAYRAHALLRDCPDGSGRSFQRHIESRVVLRFGEDELATLEKVLCNALAAGGSALAAGGSASELLAMFRRVCATRKRLAGADERTEAKAS